LWSQKRENGYHGGAIDGPPARADGTAALAIHRAWTAAPYCSFTVGFTVGFSIAPRRKSAALVCQGLAELIPKGRVNRDFIARGTGPQTRCNYNGRGQVV
jgi:hypothetical protein